MNAFLRRWLGPMAAMIIASAALNGLQWMLGTSVANFFAVVILAITCYQLGRVRERKQRDLAANPTA